VCSSFAVSQFAVVPSSRVCLCSLATCALWLQTGTKDADNDSHSSCASLRRAGQILADPSRCGRCGDAGRLRWTGDTHALLLVLLRMGSGSFAALALACVCGSRPRIDWALPSAVNHLGVPPFLFLSFTRWTSSRAKAHWPAATSSMRCRSGAGSLPCSRCVRLLFSLLHRSLDRDAFNGLRLSSACCLALRPVCSHAH
jgi:hypothetical protein